LGVVSELVVLKAEVGHIRKVNVKLTQTNKISKKKRERENEMSKQDRRI
jgi:hypothetical protein